MVSRLARAVPAAAAELAPGLLLTTAIAAAASVLHLLPGLKVLSPLILAVAIGILFRNVWGAAHACLPGQSFVLRRLLRLAIMLLGYQVSVGQILSLGVGGLVVVFVTTPAAFLFIRFLGVRAGLDPRLATLLASGTSICGASAIVAANSVVGAPEEDVAYAIASVTLFGTLAMFLYPALAPLLGLKGATYGLWAGSSIHEVAQAVAAAFQGGEAAGHAGVVAKLLRVALLAPLVMLLALTRHRNAGPAPIPWYLLGFAGVIALNSLAPPPPAIAHGLAAVTSFLMTMALAAMGLATNLHVLLRRGFTPMAVAGAGGLFMSAAALALIWWTA